MNPSTHPHEFVKHTDPDYIIQPGDLFRSFLNQHRFIPAAMSAGNTLRLAGIDEVWTPRPIPPYDTSKYTYVSDPEYIIRRGDMVCLGNHTGHWVPADGVVGKSLRHWNRNDTFHFTVYGVLTPKNVEPKKSTTIEGWLKTLPDGYRERALKNCARRERDDACLDAATAVMSAFAWDESPEGVKFWLAVKNHLLGQGKLPKLPAEDVEQADEAAELRRTLDRRNEDIVKLVDQIAAMHVALRRIRAAADEASRNTTF